MARSKFRAGDRDRAKARFRQLPRSVKRATGVALDSAAQELAEAIRRRVPEDEGDLRDSVRWARGKGAERRNGRKVAPAGGDEDITVRVIEGNKKAFYAHMVEFGTKASPAQPHFYPTWRSLKKRLVGRVKRAQAKAIREAAGE